MPGVLLDTHALYWLVSGEQELSQEALSTIVEHQAAGTLFVSPITAWELSVATKKNHAARRPNLGVTTPDRWFRRAVGATAARLIPIQQRISCEAAKVITDTGHKDPGDCFLIATARIRKIPIVTRDGLMLAISTEKPGYLDIIPC